jgi:hypothetical protein
VKLWFAAVALLPLLSAQEPPSPLLYVYREQIKPGRMAVVVHLEEEAARFCAKANCPNPYVAVSSITGPNEIIWMNGFDSAETMERVMGAYASNAEISAQLNAVAEQKAELVFPASVLLARFRDDLSFSSGITFATAHYLAMTEVNIRPGLGSSYEKIRVAVKRAQERSGHPQWVYQVTSGAEDSTFLVFSAGRTLNDLHLYSGPEERLPSVTELVRDAVVRSETRLYAVSPSMSMPARSWVEADPEFWKRP